MFPPINEEQEPCNHKQIQLLNKWILVFDKFINFVKLRLIFSGPVGIVEDENEKLLHSTFYEYWLMQELPFCSLKNSSLLVYVLFTWAVACCAACTAALTVPCC